MTWTWTHQYPAYNPCHTPETVCVRSNCRNPGFFPAGVDRSYT